METVVVGGYLDKINLFNSLVCTYLIELVYL